MKFHDVSYQNKSTLNLNLTRNLILSQFIHHDMKILDLYDLVEDLSCMSLRTSSEIGLNSINHPCSKFVNDIYCPKLNCFIKSNQLFNYWTGTYSLTQVNINKCENTSFNVDNSRILYLFSKNRIFSENNLYHTMNNLISDIDPSKEFILYNIDGNLRIKTIISYYFQFDYVEKDECFSKFSFVNEYFSSNQVFTKARAIRWRKWREILTNNIVGKADELTIINRQGSRRFLCECHNCLEPSHLNFQETRNKLARTNILFGVHGNGLTNMIFMKEGSLVIEIVNLNANTPFDIFYPTMSKYLGLRHFWIENRNDDVSCVKLNASDSIEINLKMNGLTKVLTMNSDNMNCNI